MRRSAAEEVKLGGRIGNRSWTAIPLPLKVLGFLIAGLGLGLSFPYSRIVKNLFTSGTYFP
jgi:hypothetical protein